MSSPSADGSKGYFVSCHPELVFMAEQAGMTFRGYSVQALESEGDESIKFSIAEPVSIFVRARAERRILC